MPLNLDMEQPAEHPDVTALKAKVTEVAKKYAKQYNWCNVVDNALAEAGIITTPTMLRVDITFTVAGSAEQHATKKFKAEDLTGKTTEEQNAWVAEQIAPKVNVAGTTVTLPVTVIDLNLVETGAGDPGLPEGYVKRFKTQDGRVQHIVPERNLTGEHNYRWVNALCGEENIGTSWSETSNRSEDRVCRRCSEGAEALIRRQTEANTMAIGA